MVGIPVEFSLLANRLIIEQERDVETARRALPPSSGAVMPAFLKEQQSRPVLNGRPATNYGPPIGLFHPVFDSFCSAITSTKPLPDNAATDMDTEGLTIYMRVERFFSTCADIYRTEDSRLKAVNDQLSELLGFRLIVVQEDGVKSDGLIIQPCGPCLAYLAILELKNEIGTGNADPANQGGLAYRKYWAVETRK